MCLDNLGWSSWGTRAVGSELFLREVCVKNTSASIRGLRSGSKDNVYSLHVRMSLAISEMNTENALITSPGADRSELPRVSFQGWLLTLAECEIGRARNCLNFIYSNTSILQMGTLRPRRRNRFTQGQRVRGGRRTRIQTQVSGLLVKILAQHPIS